MALVAAQRLGQPRLLQKAVEGFFDSYEMGDGSETCLVVDAAGRGWWRPMVEVRRITIRCDLSLRVLAFQIIG